MDRPIRFADLFCGIGGIRLGMESQGFQCVFSDDINAECQRTYEENFGDRPYGDVALIDEKTIPDHEILCAGFPCQPFSISGKQKGKAASPSCAGMRQIYWIHWKVLLI